MGKDEMFEGDEGDSPKTQLALADAPASTEPTYQSESAVVSTDSIHTPQTELAAAVEPLENTRLASEAEPTEPINPPLVFDEFNATTSYATDPEVIAPVEIPRFTRPPSAEWAPEEAYTEELIPGMKSFEEEMKISGTKEENSNKVAKIDPNADFDVIEDEEETEEIQNDFLKLILQQESEAELAALNENNKELAKNSQNKPKVNLKKSTDSVIINNRNTELEQQNDTASKEKSALETIDAVWDSFTNDISEKPSKKVNQENDKVNQKAEKSALETIDEVWDGFSDAQSKAKETSEEEKNTSLAFVLLACGASGLAALFFIILLFKRRKDEDEDEKKVMKMKKQKTNKALAIYLLLLSLLATLVLASCDSWMKSDEFFGIVDEEVKVANAQKISVFVRYANTKEGSTNFDGATTQKVEVPFEVQATTSDAYGFYKWAAFSTSKYSTTRQHSIIFNNEADYLENYKVDEISDDIVQFSDPYSSSTQVVINSARNDIFIIPVVAERPKLTTSLPASGASDIVRNMTIRLVFSKEMDESTLITTNEDGTKELSENIEIYRTYGTFDNMTLASIKSDFKNISLGKTKRTLSIQLPQGEKMPANTTIRVVIDGKVTDAYGYEMGNSDNISFTTGGGIDGDAPAINEMTAGRDETLTWEHNQIVDSGKEKYLSRGTSISAYSATDEILKHRTTGKVYIQCSANDIKNGQAAGADDVYMLYARHTQLLNSNGSAGPNTTSDEETYSYSSGENATDLNTTTTGFLFCYDLSDYPDGLYRIDVAAVDTIGNSGFDANCYNKEIGNYYRSIYVVKDSQPPVLDKDKIKQGTTDADAAPYNWYNKETLKTVTYQLEAANLFADQGHEYLRSNPKDIQWYYQLTTAENWQTPDATKWEDTFNKTTNTPNVYLASKATANADGEVSVTVAIRDDIGNTSEPQEINPIYYDNTPPVLNKLSWTAASGTPGIATGNILTDQTLNIEFTEATAGLKKIKLEVTLDDGSGTEQDISVAPFSATDFVAKYNGSTITCAPDVDDSSTLILEVPRTTGKLSLTGLQINGTAAEGRYTIKATITDTAINSHETNSVGEIGISIDTTKPIVEAVEIPDLKKATLFTGTSSNSNPEYWIDYKQIGGSHVSNYGPTKVTVDILINEANSGVSRLDFAGDIVLQNTTTLYLVESADDGTESETEITSNFNIDTSSNYIKVKDADDSLKNTEGKTSFTLRLKNVKFNNYSGNSTRYNTIKVTATDVALNKSEETEKSKKFRLKGTNTLIDRFYSDSWECGIEGTTIYRPNKKVGSIDLSDTRATHTNNTKNILVIQTGTEGDDASGHNAFEIKSGAKFTEDTKIYYTTSSSSTATITLGDDDSLPTGATEIPSEKFELSEDLTKITFKDENTYYVFRTSTALAFTNVEFTNTTAQGSKKIEVCAYDLSGWQDGQSQSTEASKKQKSYNSITFDTVKPAWNTTKPVYMGSSTSDTYIYPKSGNAGILIGGERYFYSKSSYTNVYLTLGYTESNFYRVAYTSGATTDTEDELIETITSSNLKTTSTNMSLSTESNPVYNFIIVDKAGNYSTVQKAHAIRDSKVIDSVSSGADDAVNTAVQAKMTYKTSESTSYKIFESNTLATSVAVASSSGVDGTGTSGRGYPVYFNTSSSAHVQVDLSEFDEIEPTATNSGIAYYAVNGSITAPSSTTSYKTDWNYWIPFDKTKPVVDLYVKSTGYDPGFVRLWLKDNVGNTKYVYVRNSENTDTARKASTENDIWLYDNKAPLKSSDHSIDIIKAAGSKPQAYNSYQKYYIYVDGIKKENPADDYDYGYMMPEGMCMFYDGTVREQDTSLILNKGSDSSSNPNRMFLTSRARLTAQINGERCYGETTSSRPADENYYSVRVVLHASSSYSPSSEDTYRNWIKNGDSTETADEIKARFRYAASKTETFLIESLPYPPGLCAERPYVHIVAEDAVGNLSAITLALYPGAKYWYSKFIMDNEPPKVYIRGTTAEVDGTTDIQKLAPPVYGKKVYTDSNGVTWFPSYGNADKAPTSESDVVQGNHMTRWADSDTAHANEQFARPYFDIDIDEDNLLAFYYSNGQHSTTLKYGDEGDEIVTVKTYPLNDFITGTEIGNSHWGSDERYTNWGDLPDWGWMILDHANSTRQGKVNAIIPHGCTDTGGEGKFLYLHLADRVGNITTIKMGDTKWARDNNVAIMGANEDGTLNSWPTKDPSILEEGLYYLKQTDDRGTLDIQFSRKANAQPYVDVYIPAEWYADPTTANPGNGGAGIYGYAWETGDVTKVQINNDETDTKHYKKPFIRFEKSKGHYEITSATPIYIYDNVGNVALTRNDANESVNFVAQNSIKSSLDLNAPKLGLSLKAQSGYTSGKFYDAAKDTTYTATSTVYIGGNSSYEFSDSGTGAGYSSSNPYIIYTNANSGTSTDKTCKLNLSLSSSDGDLYTLKITKNGGTPTTHTGTSKVTSAITNGIQIEFGASDTVLNYEIALYDFASNETKVYLKVIKDMDAPAFTPVATATEGSIGEYKDSTNTYYYYYNAMDITFTPDDGDGIGVESYNLVIGGTPKTAKTDTLYKISTADYATSLGTKDTLKVTVTDKLGNYDSKYIKVGTTEVSATSKRYWARDTVKPSISSFTTMTTSGGSGTLKSTTLYYNEYTNRKGELKSYANYDYTIKFDASDTKGEIKGYLLSTASALTSVPASTTLETKKEIKVNPSKLASSKAYFYAVDYAGNISSGKELSIEKYEGKPSFPVDCTITGPHYVNGENSYYTEDTTVTFTVKDGLSKIIEYGLITWVNDYDTETSLKLYEGTLADNTDHTLTVSISNDTFKNTEGKIFGIDIYAKNEYGGTSFKHISTDDEFYNFWIEDNSPPSPPADFAISEATTSSDSGKVFLDGSRVLFSQAGTPVTLTLTGTPDDHGGSGFKGYSIGENGEVSTNGKLTFTTAGTGGSYDIFAWDNLGNKSKVGGFTTELDNTVSNVESLTLSSEASGKGAYFDGDSKKLYYNSTKAASLGVTVSIDDPDVDHYFYGTDADGTRSESGEFTITPANGTELSFYAVDKLGNVSTPPYTITLVQDNEVATPTVSAVSPDESNEYVHVADGTYYYNSNQITEFTVTLDAITDAGAGFAKFVSGDTKSETNTIKLTSPNGDVEIKAVDKVGNVSAAATITFEKIETEPTLGTPSFTGTRDKAYDHLTNETYDYESFYYKTGEFSFTMPVSGIGTPKYYYGTTVVEDGGVPDAPDGWEEADSTITSITITPGEVAAIHKHIYFFVKDEVGNVVKTSVKDGYTAWWTSYTQSTSAMYNYSNGTMTISGLSELAPIKNIKISSGTISKASIKNSAGTYTDKFTYKAGRPYIATEITLTITGATGTVTLTELEDIFGNKINGSGISLSANINAGTRLVNGITGFFVTEKTTFKRKVIYKDGSQTAQSQTQNASKENKTTAKSAKEYAAAMEKALAPSAATASDIRKALKDAGEELNRPKVVKATKKEVRKEKVDAIEESAALSTNIGDSADIGEIEQISKNFNKTAGITQYMYYNEIEYEINYKRLILAIGILLIVIASTVIFFVKRIDRR
ncbi:Ig-like domain-containing protein [Treponema zioleckii]|uniref:Ig-like domain-containing protein n=1 Tax=Treponema zioleckii TaxID=331680 RepID=UPI001A91332D|nr:Ig-like domain-containing protein [Treponema zioleckii]